MTCDESKEEEPAVRVSGARPPRPERAAESRGPTSTPPPPPCSTPLQRLLHLVPPTVHLRCRVFVNEPADTDADTSFVQCPGP